MDNPGRMRDRLTLQRPTQIPNALGELELHKDQNWEDVGVVWAAIEPLTSNEITRARQAQLDTTHRVTIRYRSDLDTTWRGVYETAETGRQVFKFKGKVDEENRHLYLRLDCVVSGAA